MSDNIEKSFKQTTGLKDFSIIITEGDNSQEIPLVQALNIVFSDTKTPIQDFASKNFNQVALGKRLVEGTIILKENQIGMMTIKKADLQLAQNIEDRLANYDKSILPYITEKVTAYYNNKKVNVAESGGNIMKSALQLLNDKTLSLALQPSDKETTDDAGYKLVDVNFSEIQNTAQLNGAGVVVMKFFANWELT